MKFVLIDPEGIVSGVNTGLGYIASALKKHNHNVVVLDFNNKHGNVEERLQKAVEEADIIGISIKSFTLTSALDIVEKIKETGFSGKLVAGGPHITLDGKNFMQENEDFDYAIVGEGEETIIELVQIIEGKIDAKDVQGLIYRKGNTIVNENRPWNNKIDKIEFPDYTCFDSVDKNGIESYPLVTSRGCPYECSYCSVGNVIGKSWRSRSPESVVEELEQAKKKYSSAEFKVLDDNFTLGLQRAKDVCKLLIEKDVFMGWSCPNGIRADKIDNELLDLMKKSGCHTISIGVESGDMDVFKRINKGENLEDVEKAIRMIKKHEIRVEGFFIIGLPGSTYDKDKESIKFAKTLELDSASFGILVPYPGTPIWDWAQNDPKVRMLGDWKDAFHIGAKEKAIFETDSYKAKEMVKLYYIANLKMLKKKNIPKAVKIFVKSLFK